MAALCTGQLFRQTIFIGVCTLILFVLIYRNGTDDDTVASIASTSSVRSLGSDMRHFSKRSNFNTDRALLESEVAHRVVPDLMHVVREVDLCSDYIDPLRTEVVSWKPRAFVYRNFLSDAECDYMIASGFRTGLKRSEVVSEKKEDGGQRSDARTSSGAFLDSRTDATLQMIERRIAKWTRLPVVNGEGFYFLQYEVGQQYKPHHDYFYENSPGMDKYIGNSGQRTATVLLYLASPEEGGETVFPNAEAGHIAVPVRRGDALLFWSHDTTFKLDPLSMHGGAPVKKGTKYCATKWIRMKPFFSSEHHKITTDTFVNTLASKVTNPVEHP